MHTLTLGAVRSLSLWGLETWHLWHLTPSSLCDPIYSPPLPPSAPLSFSILLPSSHFLFLTFTLFLCIFILLTPPPPCLCKLPSVTGFTPLPWKVNSLAVCVGVRKRKTRQPQTVLCPHIELAQRRWRDLDKVSEPCSSWLSIQSVHWLCHSIDTMHN